MIPGGNIRITGGQQQIQGHHQQAYQNTGKTCQPEIAAYQRAAVIVVRALGELEQGAGQDQYRGRIVHDDQHMSLHQIAAGHIRPFCQMHAGQGIVPAFFYQQFFQALGTHGQTGDLEPGQAFRRLLHQTGIRQVIHIGQGHVRLAVRAHGAQPESEPGRADPAPDQIGVEQHGFHETVPGSPYHRLRVRLGDTPGGIAAHIQHQSLVKAVHQQQHRAAEELPQQIIPVLLQLHLCIADPGLHIKLQLFHHIVLHIQRILKIGKNALQHLCLAHAVDAQQAGPAFSQQ